MKLSSEAFSDPIYSSSVAFLRLAIWTDAADHLTTEQSDARLEIYVGIGALAALNEVSGTCERM